MTLLVLQEAEWAKEKGTRYWLLLFTGGSE